MTTIDRARLASLIERERAAYGSAHPRSSELFNAAGHLFGRVPMTWMAMWSGGFPLYHDRAHGNRIVDVDGHELVDFALGDTGAMAGHSPRPTVDVVTERMSRLGGVTTMLPTADAEWVGAELARRFGLPLWSFTLTATDANRWAVRLARLATGRPKILTFAYCYHGSVDEAFAVPGPDGEATARAGNVGAPVPLHLTTRVAEFNDLAGVEAQLAHGDVAAVLTEPALTNIGIVLPEPGFMEGLRALATKHGALLMIDETHTISAGPGGATRLWRLKPDIFVIGKSIGGGIPCGAYGITEELARTVQEHPEADLIDVGGWVAPWPATPCRWPRCGRPSSTCSPRRRSRGWWTSPPTSPGACRRPSTARASGGRSASWGPGGVPLHVAGARDGSSSADGGDDDLDEYFHLFLVNRGVLITPFHNMALMCPETSAADVALHTRLFDEAVDELVAPRQI